MQLVQLCNKKGYLKVYICFRRIYSVIAYGRYNEAQFNKFSHTQRPNMFVCHTYSISRAHFVTVVFYALYQSKQFSTGFSTVFNKKKKRCFKKFHQHRLFLWWNAKFILSEEKVCTFVIFRLHRWHFSLLPTFSAVSKKKLRLANMLHINLLTTTVWKRHWHIVAWFLYKYL